MDSLLNEEKIIDENGHYVMDGASFSELGIIIASDDQIPKIPRLEWDKPEISLYR
jgi:hypothetical protein